MDVRMVRIGASEDGVEGGGELAIPIADQEPEPLGPVAQVHQQVAGLLGDPGAGGMGGNSAMCTWRRPCSITTRM
jgi:hypothetical protein